jgi:hypothetical protein
MASDFQFENVATFAEIPFETRANKRVENVTGNGIEAPLESGIPRCMSIP